MSGWNNGAHFAHCSVCKDHVSSRELVKYSTRRYVHPNCAMSRWGAKFFDRITPWQATQFPYFVAKDAGHEAALIARCEQNR